MNRELIESLSRISEEERFILACGELDLGNYTAGENTVFKAARINRGVADVSLRLHTRFAEIPPHSHNFVEMVIVLSGSMTHQIDGGTVIMKEGDVLLMNKHVTHSVSPSGKGDVAANILMCDGFFEALAPELSGTALAPFADENSKKEGRGMLLHYSTDGERTLQNLAENLILELTDGSGREILRRTAALFLIKLSARARLLSHSSMPASGEQGRRAMIADYIREEYRLASLSELSCRLGVSVPHLSRTVKELFGKSFKELLLDERIDRAEELLKRTDMPIGAVIRAVGYENRSYFHREFKKRKGSTPMQLRKDCKAAT